MHVVKKLMILFIVIASFIIIYSLNKDNAAVKTQIQNQLKEREKELLPSEVKEGFSTDDKKPIDELMKSAKEQGLELTIKPVSDKYMNFPLREFMMKSSYNSAIINDSANKDAIEFVLSRGCRVLDFEIYTRKMENTKEMEYVSYSEDPEYRSIKTGLTLTLEKAFVTVAANAFSKPSPAPTDPLFIQLRIKNNTREAYSRISKMVNDVFGDKIYTNVVNGSTPIKNIMGKVVIVLDAISAPDYDKYSSCLTTELKCVPLTQSVGLLSGTVDLPKYSYTEYIDLAQTPITVDFTTDRTDVRTFMMVSPPEIGGKNMTIPSNESLLHLPIQMLLVPFYKQTKDLKLYEAKFNECESSFCPLGPIYRKSYRKNSEQ